MQAGELRWRVGFYARIPKDDGYGNVQAGFSEEAHCVVGANIRAKLGGEAVQASRLQGTNTVNITVRASQATRAVTTDWRVRDERSKVIYNIRSIIDPTGAGQWLEMLCETGVA